MSAPVSVVVTGEDLDALAAAAVALDEQGHLADLAKHHDAARSHRDAAARVRRFRAAIRKAARS
jgi:hypothetical protein